MIVGRRFVYNGEEVLVLDRRHRLEVAQQLHVEADVGWIQQHVLFRHIV